MLYGVDSAFPGNPKNIKSLGYSFVGGYIGGRALNVWSKSDWKNHHDAGLLLVPIWVSPSTDTGYENGVLDGNAALVAMQSNHLSGMLVADIEDNAAPFEWAKGFTNAVHAGSCSVMVYGSSNTLTALAGLFDSWWLADWVTPNQNLHSAPLDWSMWQYSTGPSYDYNVCRDDLVFATFNP